MDVVFLNEVNVDKNVVYVDCGGDTVINNKDDFYVFDHHGQAPRISTLSACAQVYLAIKMGFDARDRVKTIVVNHTDADSVLGVWFLQNPGLVKTGVIPWTWVESISRIDSNGPASVMLGEKFAVVLRELSPDREEKDCEDLFLNRLALCQEMYDNDKLLQESDAPKPRPGTAYAWKGKMRVKLLNPNPSFNDIYCGASFGAITDGSTWTIGKLPMSKVKNFNQGLIEALNAAERDGGWGGAPTIIGSPRPGGSKLPEWKILKILDKWVQES